MSKIECLSTFYRKYREHEITLETLNAVITKFEDDIHSRYTVLRFSLLVIEEAWDMLRRFAETRGLKGIFPKQFGRLFNKVFEYRQKFDYVDFFIPEKEMISEYIESAEELISGSKSLTWNPLWRLCLP